MFYMFIPLYLGESWIQFVDLKRICFSVGSSPNSTPGDAADFLGNVIADCGPCQEGFPTSMVVVVVVVIPPTIFFV